MATSAITTSTIASAWMERVCKTEPSPLVPRILGPDAAAKPGEDWRPPAAEVSHAMKQAIKISFEEKMYSAGVRNLRHSLYISSESQTRSCAVGVAPGAFLRFASTLMVHPKFTSHRKGYSRTCMKSHNIAAEAALYFHELVHSTGPINAGLNKALLFCGNTRPRNRRGGRQSGGSPKLGEDAGENKYDPRAEYNNLDTAYADQESVYSRAADFWQAVGWAFRCAAAFPHRWVFWERWLGAMLPILEVDLEDRRRQDKADHEAGRHKNREKKGDCRFPLIRESLLAKYVESVSDRNALREISRALLSSADGPDSEAAHYREIFQGELEIGATKKERRRLKPTSSAVSALAKDEEARVDLLPGKEDERTFDTPPWASTSYNLSQAVEYRLRLFAALSLLILSTEDMFVSMIHSIALPAFYEKFADGIRALSLPNFCTFIEKIAATSDRLIRQPDVATTLLRDVAVELLPHAAVKSWMDKSRDVDGPALTRVFLPHVAGRESVADQAKLGLVLEGLLTICVVRGKEKMDDRMKEALEKGVAARDLACRKRLGALVGQAGCAGELDAMDVVERGARGLRGLVRLLERR